MKCRRCGTEIPDGTPVCPACGAGTASHLSDEGAPPVADGARPTQGAHFAPAHLAAPEVAPTPTPAADPVAAPAVAPAPVAETVPEVAPEPSPTPVSVPEVMPAPDPLPSEPAATAPDSGQAAWPESAPVTAAADGADPSYAPAADAPEPEPAFTTEVAPAPSVSAPAADPSPQRARLERMAKRAKRRSWLVASRRGVEQQARPHLHVHDNNQSLSAFRLSDPEDRDSWIRRKRLMALVVSCALVVLLGVAVAFGTWQAELWGGHRIDDVRGMTSTDATARLVADGFEVVLAEEPSESAVGLVVSMSPEPGERADAGTTVTIYVGVDPGEEVDDVG